MNRISHILFTCSLISWLPLSAVMDPNIHRQKPLISITNQTDTCCWVVLQYYLEKMPAPSSFPLKKGKTEHIYPHILPYTHLENVILQEIDINFDGTHLKKTVPENLEKSRFFTVVEEGGIPRIVEQ